MSIGTLKDEGSAAHLDTRDRAAVGVLALATFGLFRCVSA